MKIVVLSGSPHKEGTTSKLVGSFIEGAKSVGNEVIRFDTAFMVQGCYCMDGMGGCRNSKCT